MLIKFLNNLYKKPIEYQLFWIYILGHINDGEVSVIKLKKLKDKFKYNKSTFYRIMRFGLEYFDNNNKGVLIKADNKTISIEVIRKATIEVEQLKKPVKNNKELIEIIVNYLNEKANKRFTTKNKQTIGFINARVNDGFNENDFKKVIDIKCKKWLNSDMSDYLRPQTLFSQKMESYLNEKIITKTSHGKFENIQSAVNNAKQVDWFAKN